MTAVREVSIGGEVVAVRLGGWAGLPVSSVHGDGPEAEFERREALADAAVAASEVELPSALVRRRARDLWRETRAELRRAGTPPEMYLRMVDKTEERLIVEDAEQQAREALAREAVLLAIADEAGLTSGDDERRMRDAVDLLVDRAS
jgi:FKBP-type peptidyl-prolyl cis-trans isomerase (trigger factor)